MKRNLVALLLAVTAMRFALGCAPAHAENAAIFSAAKICATSNSRLALYEDDVILCLRGQITTDINTDIVRKLRQNGYFVVRSVGGTASITMEIAEILNAKDSTVIIDGFCLSACANFLLVATKKTYVLADSIVAWHGSNAPNFCRNKPNEEKWILDVCAAARRIPDFFKKRGIDPYFISAPPTHHTKRFYDIAVRSSSEPRRNVFWMWHPANYDDALKKTVTHLSYPTSQDEANQLLTRQGIRLRLIYDPDRGLSRN
jgi:hypothetical protein